MFEGVGKGTWMIKIIKPLSPNWVAKKIIESIEKEQTLLILPKMLYLLPIIRFFPSSIIDWLANFFQATTSMNTFLGRGYKWNMKILIKKN